MKYSAFAAFYSDGRMAVWSVRGTKTECVKAAVSGMMGWREYQDLLSDQARWKACYKLGARIKRVTVQEQQQ